MIKYRPIITIADENNQEVVSDFLERLRQQSFHSAEAKMHLLFILRALDLLTVTPLSVLQDNVEITIDLDGMERTKRYEIVKPLGVKPIYELRYGLNENEHLRFTFFPFFYDGVESYVFVKVFKKTKQPPSDETDQMRDLTFQMFQRVLANPELYLKGED